MLRFLRDHGALPAVKAVNSVLRSITGLGHRVQMMLEWGIRPHPEWFDHFIDQHATWTKTRIPFFCERGVYNLAAMKQGANVLELCCGDGFNAHHFYSIRAGHVTSVDLDPKAIAHAKRHFRGGGVDYAVADIREQLPQGLYDNIIWDAAIEHFTEDEIAEIMERLKSRLKPGGILSGYTIIEEEHEQHHDHEYEFKSKEDLARVLTPHFANVKVWQTTYPTRRNLYWYASDGTVPFDADWQDMVEDKREPVAALA